jgi:hypothetical protein
MRQRAARCCARIACCFVGGRVALPPVPRLSRAVRDGALRLVSRHTQCCPPRRSRQLTFSSEEIPALHAPGLEPIDPACTPTSPDGSSPWPGDCAHDGWSARMFLHQMLSTSRSDWQPSDTESLLSRSTLAISQLRVAGGSSLSDALLPTAPDSPELYLTPRWSWVCCVEPRRGSARCSVSYCAPRTDGGGGQLRVRAGARATSSRFREAEALQGFPRGWTAGLSRTRRRRMVGNAVNVAAPSGSPVLRRGDER